MSRKFKIERDYYDTDELIYDKSFVTFEPGLTVLIGCNGSGKTTLLHQVEQKCKSNNIPVIAFDNYQNGGRTSTSLAGFCGDFDKVARDIMSSEGEKISDNISKFARDIGRFVRDNKNADQIFILMDAIDSGLSIDNILEVKNDLFRFIIEDVKKSEIEAYIIVSANEYELACDEKCFDVSSCKYVDINSYEDYKRIVIETRKKKNKRYGFEEFKVD